MTIRILVTGSRDWSRPEAVWDAIEGYLAERHVWDSDGERATTDVLIVHGGCREGADRIAAEWADTHGVPSETWVADWDAYRGAAGPIRNRAMVRAGADVCLGFANPCRRRFCRRGPGEHPSHGTHDCVTVARRRGIKVIVCSGK
jgi:YspA, cpYpsA-related SLOG family